MQSLKQDAKQIVNEAIKAVMPQKAVMKALEGKEFIGNVVVVAIGKAAWTMAYAASGLLGSKITKGIVITKYEHSQGEIPGFEIYEAGHPLLDENSIKATKEAIAAVSGLTKQDTVVFLISGGGSALFEQPLDGISLEDILDITKQLLSCGADIVEMNTIRKHLSAVKGGRFAMACLPANVFSIVLSDVVGDRLDSIASGPAYPDTTTSQDALAIVKKYNLSITENIVKALQIETPKEIGNCETIITGSVRELCAAAAKCAQGLGYKSFILSTELGCEAKDAGLFLGSVASTVRKEGLPVSAPCAIILGGETVVQLKGNGKGGRNQELALSAARAVAGIEGVAVIGVGSDGTDGPTDAAGGIVDGQTVDKLKNLGISIDNLIQNNDAYNGLSKIDALVMTGPTGTNVNDLYFALIRE